MKNFLTFVLTGILVASCELIVDVDVPFDGKKLVVNSVLTPDSLFSAQVTLNRYILDNTQFENVDDAVVLMYESDELIDTLELTKPGLYRSEFAKPRSEGNYDIRVLRPGIESVHASTSIPSPVDMEVSDLVFGDLVSANGEEYNLSFRLRFNDPVEMDNFYQVYVTIESTYTNPETHQGFKNFNIVPLKSDDQGIDREALSNAEGLVFSDGLFSGKQTEILIKGHIFNFGNAEVKQRLFIHFRTLNNAFFKYKTTAAIQDYTKGDPFSQPVKVFNNIENGFGIFGGYSEVVTVIDK